MNAVCTCVHTTRSALILLEATDVIAILVSETLMKVLAKTLMSVPFLQVRFDLMFVFL